MVKLTKLCCWLLAHYFFVTITKLFSVCRNKCMTSSGRPSWHSNSSLLHSIDTISCKGFLKVFSLSSQGCTVGFARISRCFVKGLTLCRTYKELQKHFFNLSKKNIKTKIHPGGPALISLIIFRIFAMRLMLDWRSRNAHRATVQLSSLGEIWQDNLSMSWMATPHLSTWRSQSIDQKEHYRVLESMTKSFSNF